MYNVRNGVYSMLLVEQVDAFDVKFEERTANAGKLVLEVSAASLYRFTRIDSLQCQHSIHSSKHKWVSMFNSSGTNRWRRNPTRSSCRCLQTHGSDMNASEFTRFAKERIHANQVFESGTG